MEASAEYRRFPGVVGLQQSAPTAMGLGGRMFVKYCQGCDVLKEVQ